jgi:hypothetical protein
MWHYAAHSSTRRGPSLHTHLVAWSPEDGVQSPAKDEGVVATRRHDCNVVWNHPKLALRSSCVVQRICPVRSDGIRVGVNTRDAVAMLSRQQRGLDVRVHCARLFVQRCTRAFPAWLNSIWETGPPHLQLSSEPCTPRQRWTGTVPYKT